MSIIIIIIIIYYYYFFKWNKLSIIAKKLMQGNVKITVVNTYLY